MRLKASKKADALRDENLKELEALKERLMDPLTPQVVKDKIKSRANDLKKRIAKKVEDTKNGR